CVRRCVGIVGGLVIGIDRLVIGFCGGIRGGIRLRGGRVLRRLGVRLARVFLVVLLLGLLVVLLLDDRLAHRDAVVHAEHDDDGVGFFGGENSLGRGGPLGGIALGLVFDQAGRRLVP